MDLKEIEAEFDRFFEFTTDDRSVVSSVSCRLFARHIAEIFAEELQGDIATIEQENRQLRARNERIEKERDELLAALEYCRHALEPYDDVKPRDWKSDRENLMRAHQTSKEVIAKAKGGA